MVEQKQVNPGAAPALGCPSGVPECHLAAAEEAYYLPTLYSTVILQKLLHFIHLHTERVSFVVLPTEAYTATGRLACPCVVRPNKGLSTGRQVHPTPASWRQAGGGVRAAVPAGPGRGGGLSWAYTSLSKVRGKNIRDASRPLGLWLHGRTCMHSHGQHAHRTRGRGPARLAACLPLRWAPCAWVQGYGGDAAVSEQGGCCSSKSGAGVDLCNGHEAHSWSFARGLTVDSVAPWTKDPCEEVLGWEDMLGCLVPCESGRSHRWVWSWVAGQHGRPCWGKSCGTGSTTMITDLLGTPLK